MNSLFSSLGRVFFHRPIARPELSPLLRSLLEPPPSNVDLIKRALHDHDAIDCELRGKNVFLLPLSLDGDRITVADHGLGYADKPRSRTLSIHSLRHVSIDKVECSAERLRNLRDAAKYGTGIEIEYLDERGAPVTAELAPPIIEEGEFFVAGKLRIRTKWIQDVWFCESDLRSRGPTQPHF